MNIKKELIDQLKKLVQFLNEHKIDYAFAGEFIFSTLVDIGPKTDIDIILMIKEKGSTDISAPWEGEAEFAEVLMRYKALGEKEKRMLMNTVKAMMGELGGVH